MISLLYGVSGEGFESHFLASHCLDWYICCVGSLPTVWRRLWVWARAREIKKRKMNVFDTFTDL